MGKKGKFKILSYVIEDYLIFYKSLNKVKKILAFAIIEADSFYPLISELNKFLSKRILRYYSIQINIIKKYQNIHDNSNNKEEANVVYLLNFEDNKKERIIKIFNLIYYGLLNNRLNLRFLKEDRLEKKFLKLIFNNLNSNMAILKTSNTIFFKNEKHSTTFEFYNINLNHLENKKTFIHHFLSLSRNFNLTGFLIFNFKVDLNDNLIITPYFVNTRNIDGISGKIDENINRIYNCNLIEKQKIELKDFFRFLWRNKISDNFFLFNDVSELFVTENQYNFYDLSEFNSQFEYLLYKNHINFKRLNQNLLFINENSLFFVFPVLNFKLILKIFKKFYLKYFIFMLILNEEEYNELLKIESICILEKAKIMCIEEFLKLNFDIFSDNLILKNT